MKYLLVIALLLSSLPSHAVWRNITDNRSRSEIYSQTKYFSFYSEEISGHIAYIQFSPLFLKKFYLIANLVVDKKQYTLFQTFDGDCIDRSQDSLMLNVCGVAGIHSENKNGVTLYNNHGQLKWDLRVEKSDQYDNLDRYDLYLDRSRFFENIFPFDWSISWKPMDLSMNTSGSIEVAGKKIKLENLVTYHDDTWGNWNFMTQPYFWLYAPIIHENRNIKLVIGDIYFNKSDRLMGLSLVVDGKVVRYKPEEYSIIFNEVREAGSIPLPLLEKQGNFHKTSMNTLARMRKKHQYPQQVTIETNDKKIKLRANVRMLTPYVVELPLGAQKVYSKHWNDDMVVDIEYQLRDLDGLSLEGKTVGGMEFFQNKAYGFPVMILP